MSKKRKGRSRSRQSRIKIFTRSRNRSRIKMMRLRNTGIENYSEEKRGLIMHGERKRVENK
jgi:hypothetical protein